MINVSEAAFSTHVGHGDASPGEAIPGMDGYVFDESCQPIPVEVCEPATVMVSREGVVDIFSGIRLYLHTPAGWPNGFTGLGDFPGQTGSVTYQITVPVQGTTLDGFAWELPDEFLLTPPEGGAAGAPFTLGCGQVLDPT